MAFNGSGTFVRLFNWVSDALAFIKIRADRMDSEMDGFATGLSNCVTRDGQSPPTANLPMGTFKHTGVGNATARDQYLTADQYQDGEIVYVATVGGTADVTTLTPSPAITAYVAGMKFSWKHPGNNTGAVTVNASAVGAKDLQYHGAPLVSGDLLTNDLLEAEYDGTALQLITPPRLTLASQSQNGNTVGRVTNSNAGAAATAQLQVSNGTSQGILYQYGTGFTTAGVARQNGSRLDANGAGGLTIGTSAAQPIYFGVNSTEVGRWTANTFNVGSVVDNATYPLHIERIRNGVAAAQIINSDAGASALCEFSAYNGTAAALLLMHGTGFTTAGINRQNGAKLTSFGAGGLTIATDAAQPIYFAVNSTEVGRWNGNTFNIGSTIDSAATLFSASRAQNDTSSVGVSNTDAGTAARAEFSASCGSSPLVLGMRGTGFTTSGINRQNGGFMTTGGAGGLTLATTAAQPVYIGVNSAEVARFDDSATATHTRFMIYDVDNATLERVTVGAANSGGAGFKLLRIPN